MKAQMFYLHAITPVHSGTGQTAAVIDLPIAREKATGFPILPASSFKGVLRDTSKVQDVDKSFGKADSAGALCFADQRILCLPVRSYFGTFAYVTCPLILNRFLRDLKPLGIGVPFTVSVPAVTDTIPSGTQQGGLNVQVANGTVLTKDRTTNKVFLEDLDLSSVNDASVTDIAKGFAGFLFPDAPDDFISRFALVSDNVFSFLSETATEVTARVALQDDTKTVRRGGLWYEEAVPAEAIFAGSVLVETRFEKEAAALLKELAGASLVQIGGNASTGRGLCRVVVQPS